MVDDAAADQILLFIKIDLFFFISSYLDINKSKCLQTILVRARKRF